MWEGAVLVGTDHFSRMRTPGHPPTGCTLTRLQIVGKPNEEDQPGAGQPRCRIAARLREGNTPRSRCGSGEAKALGIGLRKQDLNRGLGFGVAALADVPVANVALLIYEK